MKPSSSLGQITARTQHWAKRFQQRNADLTLRRRSSPRQESAFSELDEDTYFGALSCHVLVFNSGRTDRGHRQRAKMPR